MVCITFVLVLHVLGTYIRIRTSFVLHPISSRGCNYCLSRTYHIWSQWLNLNIWILKCGRMRLIVSAYNADIQKQFYIGTLSVRVVITFLPFSLFSEIRCYLVPSHIGLSDFHLLIAVNSIIPKDLINFSSQFHFSYSGQCISFSSIIETKLIGTYLTI